MIGLRYAGAPRAQGLWQEAPPPADRAFRPGPWGTGLQNHRTGRQHLPRANPCGRQEAQDPDTQVPAPGDRAARTVSAPAPPALLRPNPGGCGRRPWAAGFHVTCTGCVEPAQDHPQPPCQSPPAQSQTVAGSGHDPRGPPCSPGGSTLPCPLSSRGSVPSLAPTATDTATVSCVEVSGPEDSQAMISGKCWQPQYSRRSRGPRGGGSPPGLLPSRGQTSSRGGHAGNRRSLRRQEGQGLVSGHRGGRRPWPLLGSLKLKDLRWPLGK